MRRRLRIAVEIAGVTLMLASLFLYVRALLRDDMFMLNSVKDAGPSSQVRMVRFYSCEGGYAFTYQAGLTIERTDAYQTSRHESDRAGSMALHVSPAHFRYLTGSPVFVLGHPVVSAWSVSVAMPRWAVPAFGTLAFLLTMTPRLFGRISRRRALRRRGFPVITTATTS